MVSVPPSPLSALWNNTQGTQPRQQSRRSVYYFCYLCFRINAHEKQTEAENPSSRIWQEGEIRLRSVPSPSILFTYSSRHFRKETLYVTYIFDSRNSFRFQLNRAVRRIRKLGVVSEFSLLTIFVCVTSILIRVVI